MILRKPYAFFIKYFKVLHAVMAVFIAIIMYNSVRLYSFFRTYSIDYRSASSSFTDVNYLNFFAYFMVILALILTAVLLSVMIYKKKPKMLYIYNVILFVLLLILYYFTQPSLRTVSHAVLDIRVSKAFRDLYLIALLFEILDLVLMIVRASGFDIKRFDFVSDLHQLNISEKDSEEIEVALEFDKDQVRRGLKNKFRNAKYVYFEHRFIINIAVILLAAFIGIFVYRNVSAYTARYSIGETFTASSVTLNIKDSYILDSTADGTKLVETEGDNAGVIVLVRFQIRGSQINQTFNTGVVNLNIGKFSYGQNSKLASNMTDLGTAYVSQKVTEEFKTYVLAFEIPSRLANKKMHLKINDSNSYVKGKAGAKNVLVRLKPVDLRKDGQLFEKNLNETINFDDSILGSSSMTISSFEINNKFRLDYKYCYGTNKCADSYEYLTPTATGNYFKTLIKMSGSVMIDKTNNISDISDFRTLLNRYGYINYLVGEKWQMAKINSADIKPKTAKTNDYFIEIPYDVKDSSSINLTLKIRNQNYKYTLK